MAFKFEELLVWQKSIEFSGAVHELTLHFPKEELYILTSQIKRAADSICLNIAEGSTGQSDREFNRFLGYALRSGIEVVSCLHVGRRRRLVNKNQFDRYYELLTEIIKMIQALRKKLNE